LDSPRLARGLFLIKGEAIMLSDKTQIGLERGVRADSRTTPGKAKVLQPLTRSIIVSMLPLLCTVGATSAQAQASDFLQLTITNKADHTIVTTTASDPVFEFDETATGANRKLDSITVPISEPFIDPTTGRMAFSDNLVIGTISGIITSDPPTGEPGVDRGETVTLWSLDVTFTSGESDNLKVIDNTTGRGATASGESGSIMLPAKTITRDKFGDRGDAVDLNSFTISFESDPDLEPPAGTTDEADGRNYIVTIALVSDGATVPEPSTWAMMLLGFAGLVYAGFRRRLIARLA
jgi:hypothetical protein